MTGNTPGAVASEQGLIEAERPHRADPVTVSGQQRFAPGEHRPVHRVPVTTQLGGHIGDRAGVAAHRHRRPASRPRRQRRPGRRDLLIDLGERPHHTGRRRAPPPPLAPHQAHRAPERRQVHQPHRGRALGPHRPAAVPTARPGRPGADVQRQRRTGHIVDAEDLHIAETDDQLAETRRVLLHRGPPPIRCVSNPILEAPNPPIADPVPAHFRRARLVQRRAARRRVTDPCAG